jgi:glycerate-2-kinase
MQRQLKEMHGVLAEKEAHFAAELAQQKQQSAVLLQEKSCMVEVMESTLNDLRAERKTKDAEYELLVSSLYGQKEEVAKQLQAAVRQSAEKESEVGPHHCAVRLLAC